MKIAILATLVASTAAFAPAQTGKATSTALNMAFEEELGVQPPLGFFDPLAMTEVLTDESWVKVEIVKSIRRKSDRFSDRELQRSDEN